MNISFWNHSFTKKENSTKLPSGDATAVLSGKLKEPCSIERPVFTIERLAADAVPSVYHYAYISSFSRYYFVDDWSWKDGVWEAHLSIDVLGSWKTMIGNTTAYIERSSYEYDGSITDTMYPGKTDYVTQVETTMNSWYYNVAPSGGCFVLGMLTPDVVSGSNFGGCIKYYVLTHSAMQDLVHFLLSDQFLIENGYDAQYSVSGVMTGLAKAIINPLDYLTTCMWFPVDATAIGGSPVTIGSFGYWALDVSLTIAARNLNSVATNNFILGQIPQHPQAAARGDYLNHAPYTKVSVQIPPFGNIPIPSSYIGSGTQYVKCWVYVDYLTGKSQMRVIVSSNSSISYDGPIVTEATAQFGIQVPLSQLVNPVSSTLVNGGFSGAVGAITNIADKNYSGAVMNMTSIANSAMNTDSVQRTSGVEGSFLQNIMPPLLTTQHTLIVDENNAEIGRPLAKSRQISLIPGFIKCGEVSVDFPCLSGEKDRILKYMMEGFFYE